MNCPLWWRRLMKDESFLLHCEDIRDLVRCQWPIRPQVFLYFRVGAAAVMLLYLLISVTLSLTGSILGYKYFIYLTNWGYILLTITYIVKAFNVMLNMPVLNNTSPNIKVRYPFLLKIGWLLSNISVTLAFMISVIFWTLISSLVPKAYLYSISNINDHCFNSVWAFLDVVLSAHPVRLLHVYQPLCVTIIFMCFSIVYYAAGGTDIFDNPYIYSFLDWSEPTRTIVQGLLPCAAALGFFHMLAWSIAKLRQWFHRRLYSDVPSYCYTEELQPNDVNEPEKNSLLQSTV